MKEFLDPKTQEMTAYEASLELNTTQHNNVRKNEKRAARKAIEIQFMRFSFFKGAAKKGDSEEERATEGEKHGCEDEAAMPKKQKGTIRRALSHSEEEVQEFGFSLDPAVTNFTTDELKTEIDAHFTEHFTELSRVTEEKQMDPKPCNLGLRDPAS